MHKLAKAWEDRLTFERLSLAKRYMDGELRILIDGICAELSGIEQINFRAVFERKRRTVRSKRLRGKDCKASDGMAYVDSYALKTDACRYEKSGLVDDIKFVELAERRIPSFIWFEFLNNPPSPGADALYLSAYTGRFELVNAFVNRERGFGIGDAIIGKHKLPLKMIQASSLIMNRISNDQTETGRLELTNIQCKAFLASLVIAVSERLIRVASKKRVDFKFQITDVLFGPFDLSLN